jgi:hypothetical protein
MKSLAASSSGSGQHGGSARRLGRAGWGGGDGNVVVVRGPMERFVIRGAGAGGGGSGSGGPEPQHDLEDLGDMGGIKTYLIEPAPSNRTYCAGCTSVIPLRMLRLKVVENLPDHSYPYNQYYHVDCAVLPMDVLTGGGVRGWELLDVLAKDGIVARSMQNEAG